MGYEQKGWFPHLLDVVPIEARKNHTSMYTIALEGWRRGLRLKFYNKNEDNKLQIRYSLEYNGKIHHFNGSSGDLVPEKAFEICNDKGMTNLYLLNEAVPIPKGNKFDGSATIEEMVNFGKKIGFPLVIKPTDGSGGKGVIANIKDEDRLEKAIQHVRVKLGYEEILIQQFVEGEEVRVYVLGDKVLGAANRRPANIIGDGIHTVKKLIDLKNEFRKKIPHLYYRPIRLDNEVRDSIEAAGYTLDSIPPKGERIYLRKISNVSLGGDPVDYTDELTEKQKKIAINAAKAIPNLVHCGVDLIVNKEKDTAVVLELNTRPGIGSHLFPIEGISKDIPKEIIDYYFPETKGINTRDSRLYYDFGSIYNSLKGRSLIEVEIAPYIKEEIYAKKYIIQGLIDVIGLYEWTQKIVSEQKLNGHIRKIAESTIEVVIAGTSEDNVSQFRDVLTRYSRKVEIVSEEIWEKPIKVGYELINGYNSMSVRQLESQLKQTENDIKLINKETKRLEHRIQLMRKSSSWKISSPIRKISKLFKRKNNKENFSAT